MYKLKTVAKARFIKLTAETYCKNGAGLAAVEVWADKPVPRFQIKNAPLAPAGKLGLLAELYTWDAGVNCNSKTLWRRQIDRVIAERAPLASAPSPSYLAWVRGVLLGLSRASCIS